MHWLKIILSKKNENNFPVGYGSVTKWDESKHTAWTAGKLGENSMLATTAVWKTPILQNHVQNNIYYLFLKRRFEDKKCALWKPQVVFIQTRCTVDTSGDFVVWKIEYATQRKAETRLAMA